MVAAGASVTVSLFTTSASVKIPPTVALTVKLDTPSADLEVLSLSGANPVAVLQAPGTYRVLRPSIADHGVDVGVFTES